MNMYQVTVRKSFSSMRTTFFFECDGDEEKVVNKAFDMIERDHPDKYMVSLLDLNNNRFLLTVTH